MKHLYLVTFSNFLGCPIDRVFCCNSFVRNQMKEPETDFMVRFPYFLSFLLSFFWGPAAAVGGGGSFSLFFTSAFGGEERSI